MEATVIEIQRADASARRAAVGSVIALAVFGCMLIAAARANQERIVEWLAAKDAAKDAAMGPRLVALGAVALVIFSPLFAFAAYLWTLGRDTIGAERFPPPGRRVVRDTPVVIGDDAARRGRALRFLALALVGASGLAIALLVGVLALALEMK